MLTERYEPAPARVNAASSVVRFAMFDDMLDNVVAVFIYHHFVQVLIHFVENRSRLIVGAVFQNPLNYTTAVWMCRQIENLYQSKRKTVESKHESVFLRDETT